jgi:hypothetical protein
LEAAADVQTLELEESQETFTLEKLQETIQEIIQEFKLNHKNLETTVLKQPYSLNDEQILFYVSGEIQEGVFQKIKPEILKLLRTKLKNNKISLHVEIREDQGPNEKKLYTSTDKLNFLKQKSPALGELQKRFGLETDF